MIIIFDDVFIDFEGINIKKKEEIYQTNLKDDQSSPFISRAFDKIGKIFSSSRNMAES